MKTASMSGWQPVNAGAVNTPSWLDAETQQRMTAVTGGFHAKMAAVFAKEAKSARGARRVRLEEDARQASRAAELCRKEVGQQ